ncbi:hypothetical protein DFP72DRAFT_1063548 [Ephemerocybe angulata]|uniref:Uncharacterized protein n=1 Tax=Ephemerocybe angulata TaxID=980116 RepID=A0A8H6I9L3_9AGAR|nr:hypothetical protein DFP72DRAFT_1063548 [Tulosesus angulatus]
MVNAKKYHTADEIRAANAAKSKRYYDRYLLDYSPTKYSSHYTGTSYKEEINEARRLKYRAKKSVNGQKVGTSNRATPRKALSTSARVSEGEKITREESTRRETLSRALVKGRNQVTAFRYQVPGSVREYFDKLCGRFTSDLGAYDHCVAITFLSHRLEKIGKIMDTMDTVVSEVYQLSGCDEDWKSLDEDRKKMRRVCTWGEELSAMAGLVPDEFLHDFKTKALAYQIQLRHDDLLI